MNLVSNVQTQAHKTQWMDRLKTAMTEEIEHIDQRAQKFPWEKREFYLEWLAQTYFYVAHTTRLLALAAGKTSVQKEWIYSRFVREIHEENGHELLLVRDLKAMGAVLSDFKEFPETAFFYQTLGYLIENEDPLCILGYSLTLEGLSALKTETYSQKAVGAHGEKACHFLKVHGELDKTHFRDGLEFLSQIEPTEAANIEKGVRQCGVIYRGILEAIYKKRAGMSQ